MIDFYNRIFKKKFLHPYSVDEDSRDNAFLELLDIEKELEFLYIGCDDKLFEDFLKEPGIYTIFCRFKYLLKKYHLHPWYSSSENPEIGPLCCFIWSVPEQDQFGDLGGIKEPYVFDNGEVICGIPSPEIDSYYFDIYVRDYIMDCYRLYYRSRYDESLAMEDQIDDIFTFYNKRTFDMYQLRSLKINDDTDTIIIDKNRERYILDNPTLYLLNLD